MEPTSSKPAQLSCTNCRHRKVKCDKTAPCSACRRSNIECVFPTRPFKPRGKQGGSRARNVEIAKRLNRLEGLMSKLGGEGAAHALLQEAEARDEPSGSPRPEAHRQSSSQSPNSQGPEPMLKPDGSRYLSSDFWSSLSGEVGGLRQLLDEPSEDEEEPESHQSLSPSTSSPFPETHFVFGSRAQITDLRSLHPCTTQIALLVEIYFNNVDPLFKVLHKPTCSAAVLGAADNLANGLIDSGLEALMFAMYLTATTSLNEEQCLRILGQQRDKLLAQFKYGTEAALANADFLSSLELVTLQAFAIYLLCLRNHNENRSTWTLIALAVRLAHSLGLNSEAAVSAYSPFEAEMRRRLWFEINVLDVRSSEDRGSPSMIVPDSFDTKIPYNVNDADIGPLSFSEIYDRVGCTEMTFNLITLEASVFARVFALPDHNVGSQEEGIADWYRRKAQAEELRKLLHDKYLVHCDTSVPLYWVCKTVATVIGLKMQLHLQYPMQGRRLVPESERDRTANMKLAVEMLEHTEAVEHHGHAAHFRWFIKTYVQWHPLAVVLAELCVEPGGPYVDRAWAAIDTMMERLGDRIADSRKGTLWRPLKKLHVKAQAARARHERMHPEQAPQPRQEQLQQDIPRSSTGLSDISTLKLEDAPPPPPPSCAAPRDPLSMPTTTQDMAGLEYSTAYGALPSMDFAPDVDPMDLEGWDEFLRSTATWDDGSAAGMMQGTGGLPWSMPFSMGSVLP